ncbi:MAG: enoyl-CoA hydratase/isomerase family protein [Myxococcota bacterium]|nr:enoyl-CoA hydratase/isomerase family protein [Myxococcota bacterium]
MTELTLLAISGHVATLTLNRPAKRNALCRELRFEIVDRLQHLKQDERVRCVILAAQGPAFCAGFDRSELASGAMEAIFQESQEYHRSVYTFPKPLIAAIGGAALGGGCDLAALCDVRIATPSAVFGQPQVRFGAAAAYGLMRQVVPEGTAREMCLTGRTYSAEEALQCGLVSAVCSPEDLPERVSAMATAVASLPDPMARTIKQDFLEAQPILFKD